MASPRSHSRNWAGLDPLLLPLDYSAEVEDQAHAPEVWDRKGLRWGVRMAGRGWGPGWGEEEMLGIREKRNKCVFPASVSPAQLVHSGCSENVDRPYGGHGRGWIKCGPCPQGGGLDIRSVWKQNKFNQQAFIEHLLCVWRYLDIGDPALNKTHKKPCPRGRYISLWETEINK